jgi:hypothetical protein
VHAGTFEGRFRFAEPLDRANGHVDLLYREYSLFNAALMCSGWL